MNGIASGADNNGGFRFQRYSALNAFIAESMTILVAWNLYRTYKIYGRIRKRE